MKKITVIVLALLMTYTLTTATYATTDLDLTDATDKKEPGTYLIINEKPCAKEDHKAKGIEEFGVAVITKTVEIAYTQILASIKEYIQENYDKTYRAKAFENGDKGGFGAVESLTLRRTTTTPSNCEKASHLLLRTGIERNNKKTHFRIVPQELVFSEASSNKGKEKKKDIIITYSITFPQQRNEGKEKGSVDKAVSVTDKVAIAFDPIVINQVAPGANIKGEQLEGTDWNISPSTDSPFSITVTVMEMREGHGVEIAKAVADFLEANKKQNVEALAGLVQKAIDKK